MKPRLLLRTSLRTRLTLIYGGLFLAFGLVLLGVTFVLVDYRLPPVVAFASRGLAGPGPTPGPGPTADADGNGPFLRTVGGDVITANEAPEFLLAEQRRLRDTAMNSLLTQSGVALALVGTVAVGMGWLVAGRVLAPLHRVTETARRIADSPTDLGLRERIAIRGPDDEVKELADTFDTMVARLDRSFDSQRRFVANASHELRTPLTLNRALVEVAMHRRNASADVRQLGETLLEINTRHERLISGLLLLARSEGELSRRVEVDLADIVAHVCAQATAEAATNSVTVREESGTAPTMGDPVLLERLAQNLVENALRHNLTGGFALVGSRTLPDGRACLEVTNTGPVVPPYEIPGLFEPFRRLGEERLVTAKGAGLGLSIVRSVARAHGGEVAARPNDGGGLVVTVTLPPPAG